MGENKFVDFSKVKVTPKWRRVYILVMVVQALLLFFFYLIQDKYNL